jgi:NADH:ubiquinone oxidoreductase subunit H
LIKLATKEVFIIPNVLTTLVPIFISLFFIVQLLFIQNFIFGPSLFLFFNLDGLIFYHLILVMLSNIVLLGIGFLSQSKYSLLGIFRAVIHIITLDVVITVVYILLILNTNSGNFHDFIISQSLFYFIILFSPLALLFLMIMLLEAKRAPFDHIETESEVVSGYATEYSSIYLLVFYLIEYFHLIISANHFTICFLGG